MQEPEIDDELAELEANAPGAQGKTRQNVHKFIQAIQGMAAKTAPTAGPTGKPTSDRTKRRALMRGVPGYKPDPKTRPHARLGRAKPVKSQAQLASEYRAAARGMLTKAKLTLVLPHCPEVKYVMEGTRIKNVWTLSQMTQEQINAVPGLGPKRRKALWTYLREHQVPTVWAA